MIRRLRIKFILISFLSLFAVLALFVGGINYFNYRHIVENADDVLEILADGGGNFPERMRITGAPVPDSAASDGRMPEELPPMDHGRFSEMSPELPYESRYFTVTISSEGEIVDVNTGMIAAVDTSAATEYAQELFDDGKTKGFKGDYRYTAVEQGEDIMYIFYDCGRQLESFHNVLTTSILLALVGLAAVIALIIVLSAFMTKPVAESYEKQKRFITDAGHEIKTPLTIINADADVLAMENDSGNEWIDDIRKQTDRLTELTNDLIFLSRMEEDKPHLTYENFDFSADSREIADSFKSIAITQGKTLTTDIEDGINIYADRKALRQLVSILLDNALKYSPDEGHVKVVLERSGKNVKIAVQNDLAEEMTDDKVKRLFDRFYRTDDSRNSTTGGHGLGLSIAKAVTEAHKGKISAICASEKKLTISAVIPIRDT